MRLFVALALPESLRERLGRFDHGLPGARWVAPENLHLTLRFIGEADGGQARDIDMALTQLRTESFAVTLSGLGHFGGHGKLRSLWIGVSENAALERLHDSLERALRHAGVRPEGRKFKPHVTLARFSGNPGSRLQDYIARYALFRGAPFPAEEFILYSSFLSRKGALYTPEAVYPLPRPAPIPQG